MDSEIINRALLRLAIQTATGPSLDEACGRLQVLRLPSAPAFDGLGAVAGEDAAQLRARALAYLRSVHP